MDENNGKIVKKVIKRQIQPTEESNTGDGSKTFLTILNVAMFLMVLIIFFRGFNIKGTVTEECASIKAKLVELETKLETARQIDKNEILSAFALYSRLDAESLKAQEEYHKQQQSKYENIANQYNQSLNSLTKVIKTKKDSVK